MSNQCVICDNKNPEYPNVDATTGFTFCGDCWYELRTHTIPQTLSDWLRQIASLRDEKQPVAS